MYVDYVIDDRVLFSFKDYMTHKNDLNTFKRILNKTTYFITDSELKLIKTVKKCKFIKSIPASLSLSEKYLTMDLECRRINNKLEPYCLSIYDGHKNYSFYLSDYSDSDSLLKEAIISIMKRKYNRYKVYLHNFSKFDGVFLLRILTTLSENIQPIIKDGKIIEIKFYFAEYVLVFRDSLLLLPSSLYNLGKVFDVENKGTFPA